MRRNVGGHADRDAAGTVDQKIRNARRQNHRFFARLVEVWNEIDSFFFQIGKNVFGDLRQARFRVPHGRGRIAIDRTEIPLTIDQRIAHVEILRQPHQGRINHRFTVRVVVAGSVSTNFRALTIAAVRSEAEIVHRHQDAPLHRLQPVANVGQSARDNHAHRIVEVRLAHFRFNINRKQYRCVLFVRHVPSVLFQVVIPNAARNLSVLIRTDFSRFAAEPRLSRCRTLRRHC